MIGPDAGIHVLQIDEALHGQSAADQQHAGESDLRRRPANSTRRLRPSDGEDVGRLPSRRRSHRLRRRAARGSVRKSTRRRLRSAARKASARPSTAMAGRTISAPASAIGRVAGRTALSRSTPQTAKKTPSAPPIRLSSRLSLRICAIRRLRARAQGDADSHLFPPAGDARQHQARDVYTGQQAAAVPPRLAASAARAGCIRTWPASCRPQ